MRLTNDIRDRIIRDIMADIPVVAHEDVMRKRAMEIAVSLLPADVLAVYNGPNRHWIETGATFVCCVAYKLPGLNDYESRKAREAAIEGDEVWAAAHQAHDEQRENRKALMAALRVNLAGCSTRKQFVERFPELAKYAPQDTQATANLPATNELVERLQSAGLPVAEAA